MTDAPKRIWIDEHGGNWSSVSGGTQGHEYHRADLSADLVQAALKEAADRLMVMGDMGGMAIVSGMATDPEAIAAIVARVTEGK